MRDLIDRQAAIDLVRDVCDAVMSGCESWYDPETEDEVFKDIREVDAILKCNKEARIALRNMPSAQSKQKDCESCRYNAYEWDEEPCDSCIGVGNHWKPSAESERHLTCKNCIHLGHAYMMPCKNCKRNQMLPDWYEERREE